MRHAAHELHSEGTLPPWQYNAVLTAIMSAASAAVHSAGKHFAQPLSAGSSPNHEFLRKRLLEDRRVCVFSVFMDACRAIDISATSNDAGHRSEHTTAEEFVASVTAHYDMYYLDPPYTAQQYSRFYHILETLVTYNFPKMVNGASITTGLYPSERFKSAFSSKKQARQGFRSILQCAKRNGTSVLISYSESSQSSNGNARMITLPALLEECREHFGCKAVDSSRMRHKYRQFNSAANSNNGRDDSEILIACKAR